MVGGAINIKLTIEEKAPVQMKINVSIANQKSSSSTDKYSGGSSSRVTETYKARFVDGSSGRESYREEANYKSIRKVNDKVHSGEIQKSSGRESYREEANYKSIRKVNDKVHSGEIRKSLSSTHKNSGGSSSRVTEKAGVFVERRSGREEYREEANYKSSYKVNGKAHGVTTEFEASIKYKKTTTYDNSYNYKSVTKY